VTDVNKVPLPVYYDNADQVVPVTVVFTKVDGTPTAPATVAIVVTDPHGTATTYTYIGGNVDPNEVVSDSNGAFHIWLTSPATPGLWTYVWMGSGGSVNQGFQIFTGTFRVLSYSDVGMGMTQWYCSKEELKSRLSISQSDTTDDYEIQLALQTVTDWITTYCARHFYRISEIRTFRPDNVWNLAIDDLVTCTSMDLDYDGDGVYEVHWTEGVNFQLMRYQDRYNAHNMGVARPNNYVQVLQGPANSNPIGGQWFPWLWPFTHQNRVQITGIWGWADVPPNVTSAALILASDLFKAKDAPWGIAGFGDLGMVKVQSNPWVVELLRPYINFSAKVGC
jgi:hypothetical protein